MKPVTNLRELCEVSHQMAVEHGWWDKDRTTAELFNNFHAEISEAWEEYRAGRMGMWFAGGSTKPEGFWVEIADLLIRIADWCGSLQPTPAMPDDIDSPRDIPTLIEMLHENVVRGKPSAECAPEDIACWAYTLLEEVYELSADVAHYFEVGIGDLWSVINIKLAYNAGRSFRHGNKLA